MYILLSKLIPNNLFVALIVVLSLKTILRLILYINIFKTISVIYYFVLQATSLRTWG